MLGSIYCCCFPHPIPGLKPFLPERIDHGSFSTQYGDVKVFLPVDVRSGDMISGTVVAEPKGNNARQVEKNIAELVKFNVSIAGNKYAVADKQSVFKWLVRQDLQTSAPIELIEANGRSAGKLNYSTNIFEGEARFEGATTFSSRCVIPTHALTAAPVRITGSFDGDLATTKCLLNSQPMQVLTESPRECVAQYPETGQGQKTLQVNENGKEKCTREISGVDMQVTTGDLNLRKGQNTYIDVKLTGLQNLPDTAFLTIANVTPNIVTMMNGNLQVFPVIPDSTAGTFSVHCPAVSITTGRFVVNINLDLPDVMLSPGPGDNQDGKCNCSVKATISKPTTINFRGFHAALQKNCGGQNCSETGITKKWEIISGFENIESAEMRNENQSIYVSPKGSMKFILKFTVTVTCSDGSTCTDVKYCDENGEDVKGPADEGKTEEPRQPTEPQKPKQGGGGCACDGSCKIIITGESATHMNFEAVVKAICKGYVGSGGSVVLCEASYILKWHVGESGKDVAEMEGATDKKGVKLKIKKPGQFTLYLTLTITCTDGKECVRVCNVEITIPPPLPQPPFCILSWQENELPKMTGRLKPKFAAKYTIRRDEFIPLGAEGKDDDQLTWSCTPVDPPCKETGGSRSVKLNGRVRFEWVIKKGEGSFVKLGCLPDKEFTAFGDYTIFKPPVLPLPIVAMDTVVTTLVELRIIDDNPTQPQDDFIKKEITIIAKRSRIARDKKTMGEKKSTDKVKAWSEIMLKEDLYEITVTSDTKEETVAGVPAITSSPACKPLGPQFTKLPQMGKPEIELPDVPKKEIVLLGQWIILNAKDVRDNDLAQKIFCESKKCIVSPPHKKVYEDNVLFNWSLELVKGGEATKGRFGNGLETDVGAAVIYKTPDVWPEAVKGDYFDIKINMYASNPDEGDRKDVMASAMKTTIRVYKPGVKLDKTPLAWLPEDSNTVALTSQLMYLDDSKWNPAPPHACRIHFFELMNVSRLKGICMNYPEPDKADSCRDLLIPVQKNLEVFNDTISGNCATDSLFLQARTLEPVNSFSVIVESRDYASFGLLRSFANLNKGGRDSIRGEKPVYTPLSDPHSVYKDNRVTIPQDQDENGIADRGWMVKGGIMVPDPRGPANEDKDDKPKGNSIAGDGLTDFEEYRGFKTSKISMKPSGKPGDTDKVMKPEEETPHVRTDPKVKNVFIRNKHGFLITSYTQATGIDAYEINKEQYINDETRIVNFNIIPGKHVVDQMGLYLYDGRTHSGLLGCAWNNIKLCGMVRPAPPNWEDSIVIYKEAIERSVGLINHDIDSINEIKTKKKEKLLKNLSLSGKIDQVVAHELSHGCNICHHGEEDDELKGKDKFDIPNGLRSGNMDCIMRYDNVGARRAGFLPETPGTILCDNPAGTGYNPGAFGNAADGRGNCQAQLQVTAVDGLPPVCLGSEKAWKEYRDAIEKKKKAEAKSKK